MAGHPPILVLRGDTVLRLGTTGAPLGLLPGLPMASERLELSSGDLLLFYTDGVIEAGVEADLEEYGVDRLADLMAGADSPQALLDRVSTALSDLPGRAPPPRRRHDAGSAMSARPHLPGVRGPGSGVRSATRPR